MRLLFRLFLLTALLAMGALAVLLWAVLADAPLAVQERRLSHEDIGRAKAVLRAHNPRHRPPGTPQRISLSGEDLDLAANYLFQTYANGGARVELAPGKLQLSASLQVPRLPLRPYLNLHAVVPDDRLPPRLTRLQLGALAVPDWLTERLLRWGLSLITRSQDLQLANETIQQLAIDRDAVHVTYRWQPGIISAVRQSLLPEADIEALAVYHKRLVQLNDYGYGKRGSLTSLLPPLFALAAERSSQRDPVAENRALLLVLGAWASGRGMGALLPEARVHPWRFLLTLEGRRDLAQHFLVSAALAAAADTTLADAVGVFKEVSDADGGSGFSFTDLAADRAGTRFGERAVRSPDSARALQQQLAAGIDESAILPRVGDLPEYLSEAEFRRRYTAVGSPAYQALMQEIEQRLDTAALLND
jgi:hypothetical protein